jgi:hypothetical protein
VNEPQRHQPDVGRLLADLLAGHRVVDLTVPLADTLPCTWPGHMPFRGHGVELVRRPAGRPAAGAPSHGGGYQTRWLVLDEHAGTAIDAPRHFVPPPSAGLAHADPAGVGVDRLPCWRPQAPRTSSTSPRLGARRAEHP